ncbi:MAG: hypothetical protein AMXMBFR82_26600 [Candidatus Hydrogenedentota bacterium]
MVNRSSTEPDGPGKVTGETRVQDPPVALSEDIRVLLERADGKPMAFGTILNAFPRRTHAMLLVFLSFPMCLPITIPLGAFVAFVALFLFIGRPPWIPRRLREKQIPYARLVSVSNRLLRTLARLERLLHPRLEVLSGNSYVIRIHAVTIFVLALIVVLPLPIFFANMVAAVPIFLIALGLLERDGYFIIAGYVAISLTVAYYGGLALLGREGFEQLLRLGG